MCYYVFTSRISLSHVNSLRYRSSASHRRYENTSNFRPEFTSVSVDVRRTLSCRVWVRTNKADVQRRSEDLSVKTGFVCGMADLRRDDSVAWHVYHLVRSRRDKARAHVCWDKNTYTYVYLEERKNKVKFHRNNIVMKKVRFCLFFI